MKTTAKRPIAAGLFALLLAAAAEAQEGNVVEAGEDGFALASENADWRLRLRGLVHFDGRAFLDDSAEDGASEWLLRRLRPSFEGSLGDRLAFRIMPDFGEGDSEIVDAWIDVGLGGNLTLRAGKFKAPVGLERLQSSNDLRLIERSIANELIPNRDIGVQLSGGERLGWAVGLLNGVEDGRSGDGDDDGNQELAVRLFAEPLDEAARTTVGIGIAGTYGSTEGSPDMPLLASYRSPGQNAVFRYRTGADGTFADGERLRVTPQFYWYRGPFGLLGEWVRVSQDVRRVGAGFDRAATLDHEAWQITGEWFVTGEDAGYRDPGNDGAIQLVARIGRLTPDVDSFADGPASFADPATAVAEADTFAVGVNLFPSQRLKASVAYQQTAFEGGAAAGDRVSEKVLLMRLQTSF